MEDKKIVEFYDEIYNRLFDYYKDDYKVNYLLYDVGNNMGFYWKEYNKWYCNLDGGGEVIDSIEEFEIVDNIIEKVCNEFGVKFIIDEDF